MDNTRIEEKAVSVVKELFLNQSKKIGSNIVSGDKGISFDGNAILFSNEEITKSTYLSSIPVQVKGTEVDCFSESVAKFYDFDKDTFKNFQYEDGVVVFLVEISKENIRENKVFSCFLDTADLEIILNELQVNGRYTRVIELDELTSEVDLDEKFREIAIRRKAYGFKDAKLDTFLKKGSSIEIFQNDFDKNVVEESRKTVELYEYKIPSSQFNIELKKRMMEVLSQTILLDTFAIAENYGKIVRLGLLEVLPEENRYLALLIKVRYLAMNGQFESAREVLKSMGDPQEKIKKIYERALLEANLDNNDLEKLLTKTTLSSEERNLYKGKYYLIKKDINQFHEILFSNLEDNRDWKYLRGEYFLYIGNSEAASEIFYQLSEESFMVELKYKELFSRFTLIRSEVFFIFQERTEASINKLNLLLNEIGSLRRKVEKLEHIEMPALEELFFEIKILLNPEEGLKIINDSLSDKEKDYNGQYLREWKIRALFLLGKYDEALNYINLLPSDIQNNNVIMFKILLLIRNPSPKDAFEFISSFICSNESEGNERLFGFMTYMYLKSTRECQDTNEKDFENFIQFLVSKYQLDFPLLLDLENTRKKLGYKNYGSSFELFKNRFNEYPDERKIDDIAAFLLQNNELVLAENLYFDIRKVNKQIADEIITALYLFNDKSERCLEVLEDYSDTELSEKMLAYKAEAYNRTDQYRATLKLYKTRNEKFNEYLIQVLIAKIVMGDSVDIDLIVEQGMKSDNTNFEVNVALAQIKFALDVKKGFQIIEKYVLKNQFDNRQLNLSIIQSALIEIKEDTSLDTYLDVELKWFKFKTEEGYREFVLVPSKWNIPNFDNLEFQETDSDFKLMVQGISVGDYVEFEDESVVLIEEKPLSVFIIHRVMKRESGGIGSGKPLTSITLDLEGNILDELTKVLKEFDRTEQYNEIKNFYNQFHAPFVYSHMVSEEEMFEFYFQIFNDTSTIYYVGDELSYYPNINYQISISSIAFLASLDLLEILKEYQNIFIEKTQKNWIENIFSKKLNSKHFGRLGLLNDDELFLNEETEEQKRTLTNTYRRIVLGTKKLRCNDIGKIASKINCIIRFDESNIQAAIDYENVLLNEDEAIQIIGKEEFGLQVSSIGMLINHYFLDIEKNVDKYLDIQMQAIKQKSAWRLQKGTLNRIIDLVERSNNINLIMKFNIWGKAYTNFFYFNNLEKTL
ncbi:hypothetical protein JZO81_02840 [Enterococcus hulanensis]|nr:hypothetical protein [Enterococcus hulanensis]MBO0409973.1 hypothetical protein [Enterococcus hulanensis]